MHYTDDPNFVFAGSGMAAAFASVIAGLGHLLLDKSAALGLASSRPPAPADKLT